VAKKRCSASGDSGVEKKTFPHQNLPSGRKIGFLASKAKKEKSVSKLEL
jgi:hypothetical protein